MVNTLEMFAKGSIRILRIIARLNIGGPAIQAISLTHAFSKDPCQTLLVCGHVGIHEGNMSYLAEEKGVQPLMIPELGREISPYDDLKAFKTLRKIVKQFNPHIIHTHTAKAGTLGRLAGISFNFLRGSTRRIKLVHTFHGHIFHSYFGSLKTFLFIQIERLLGQFTDKIIVISPIQRNDICERFKIAKPEKVRIIPLGFDLSNFSEPQNDKNDIRKRYLSDDSKDILLVGIVGRLTYVKNHRMLLEAVNWIKDAGGSDLFRFLVIGDGELRKELKKYSEELGIQGLVNFVGWQKDMPAFYKAMDIIALTSLNEGTPVTLIEAMASGKPAVATDVGGVRDLLGSIDRSSSEGYKLAKNGILIPSGRADILAKALFFLRENKQMSDNMAEHARKDVLDRFSMERLVGDIGTLYKELMGI